MKHLLITGITALAVTIPLTGCGTQEVARTTPVTTTPAASVPQPWVIPSGTPSARCKDGTYDYSYGKSEACLTHGGIAVWWGP
jgi:hypothetical protein